jgi:hypothetical protein
MTMNEEKISRRVARWLVLAGATVFGGPFIAGGAVTMLHSPDLYQLMLKEFAATVGLPSAALLRFAW